MIEKLKRCPFCGSEVELVIRFQGLHFFKCKNKSCGACISFDNNECNQNKSIANKHFNRRYEEKKS